MILFIDDEPRYVDAYRRELEDEGYQVRFISDIDEAIAFFSEHQAEVELVILDIMMPAGRAFGDTDTKKGRRTGVHVYAALHAIAPSLQFVILTNVSDPEVEKVIEGGNNCRFVHKYEYLPFEVKEIVQAMFGSPKEH